jgi:hypothetical protein
MNHDEFFTEVPTGTVQETDVPRDGHGRYLLSDPVTGEVTGHTRVTTLSSALDNGRGLGIWNRRTIIRGMGLRADLVARAGSADPEDPGYSKLLDSIGESAFEAAGGNAGSNLGTAQHIVFKRYFGNQCKFEDVPDYFHSDLRAVIAELERCKVKILPQYVERTVRCSVFGKAGRIDGLAELEDGTLAVIDLKTEKDPIDYPEGKTVQLAYYANSDLLMDYATQQYELMPVVRTDFALVIHCRPGSGEARMLRVPIDLGWMGARIAEELYAWRKLKIVVAPYISEGMMAPPVQKPAIVPDGHGQTRSAQIHQLVGNAAQQAQQTGQPIDAAVLDGLNVAAAQVVSNPTPTTYQPSTNLSALGLPSAPAEPPGKPVVGPGSGAPAATEPPGELRPGVDVPSGEKPPVTISKSTTNAGELLHQLLDVPLGAVDPVAETAELAELKKPVLQDALRMLSPGIDEAKLRKHREPLAALLVELLTKQRQLKAGPHQPITTQEPPSQPVPSENGFVDMTYEGVMRAIAEAPNMDRLSAIYQQWVATYGPENWTGAVLDAANNKMAELNGRTV